MATLGAEASTLLGHRAIRSAQARGWVMLPGPDVVRLEYYGQSMGLTTPVVPVGIIDESVV